MNLNEAKKILKDNGYTLTEGIFTDTAAKIASKLSGEFTPEEIKAFAIASKIENYVAKTVPAKITDILSDDDRTYILPNDKELYVSNADGRACLVFSGIVYGNKEQRFVRGYIQKTTARSTKYPISKNVEGTKLIITNKSKMANIYEVVKYWNDIKEWLQNIAQQSQENINTIEADSNKKMAELDNFEI